MEAITQEFALDLLRQDADRIRSLIKNQKNSLCISQCKAFEEVVDTQMYGLSRQVTYAIRLGIVESAVGHQVLSDLERDLNSLYSDIYEEQTNSGEEE